LRENKKDFPSKAGGNRQLQQSQRLSFNGPAKGSDRLNSHQNGRIRSFESSERFELARWKRSMETYQPKKVRNASVTLQPDCKQACVPLHYLSNLISLLVWPIFCVWTILDNMLKKSIVCNASSMQKLANATREFHEAEREMHIASKKLQDAIALSQRVNARYQVCTCLNNFTF
jgi:ABC-type transport system involved in Fe-S cluster assembly fused permease/ATPase subunit